MGHAACVNEYCLCQTIRCSVCIAEKRCEHESSVSDFHGGLVMCKGLILCNVSDKVKDTVMSSTMLILCFKWVPFDQYDT